MAKKELPNDVTNKIYFRNTILALFFTLLFVLVVGATLAYNNAYTTGTITFRGNILTEITDFTFDEINYADNPMLPDTYTLWPGAVIKGVTLKVKVSREDSVDDEEEQREGLAYVRVKFDLKIDGEDMQEKGLVYLENDPDNVWKLLSFEDGDWYVLCDSNNMPRALKNGETVSFTEDNRLVIDSKMTNEYANKKINVDFVVQSLQRKNLTPETILTGNNGNPYWQLPIV